jgi:glutathione S-transferase
MLFYTERYGADVLAEKALRARLHPRVLAHLALLEAELARHGGPWLLGDEISMCDLYLAACVRWSQLYPRGDALGSHRLQELPRLLALLQVLEARPVVRRAFAAEGIAAPYFVDPSYPSNAVV